MWLIWNLLPLDATMKSQERCLDKTRGATDPLGKLLKGYVSAAPVYAIYWTKQKQLKVTCMAKITSLSRTNTGKARVNWLCWYLGKRHFKDVQIRQNFESASKPRFQMSQYPPRGNSHKELFGEYRKWLYSIVALEMLPLLLGEARTAITHSWEGRDCCGIQVLGVLKKIIDSFYYISSLTML